MLITTRLYFNAISKAGTKRMYTNSMQIHPKFVAGYNVNHIVKIDVSTSGYLGDYRKVFDIHYQHGNYLHHEKLHEGTEQYAEMAAYLQSQNSTVTQ